jgi:hypothetical protein
VGRNHSGVNLPLGWDEKCAFPLWHELRPRKQKPLRPPLPLGTFSKSLPNISVAAHAFIESVQPYYCRLPNPAPINAALDYLGYLSNLDKHRRQVVTRNDEVVHSDFQPIDHGTKLPPPYWNPEDGAVHVMRTFSPFVAINESGVLGKFSTYSADYVLRFIVEEVKAIVVPAMANLIENRTARST